VQASPVVLLSTSLRLADNRFSAFAPYQPTERRWYHLQLHSFEAFISLNRLTWRPASAPLWPAGNAMVSRPWPGTEVAR